MAFKRGHDRTPTSGALRWGVKTSLVDFIRGLPDGTVLIANGAAEIRTGIFEFPLQPELSSWDARSEVGMLQFRGQVVLRGHGRTLNYIIEAPSILINGPEGILCVVDFPAERADGDMRDAQRTPFALLTPRDTSARGLGRWRSASTSLTQPANDRFLQYELGHAFDPIELSIE
jgi:Htaa